MGFSCGITGLANVGKSTIFNALTSAHAQASNYPFCTIEPNIGIVKVPDKRLYDIYALIPREKVTPTTMTFVDIAGLVRGASKGEGLGNQFLGHIREMAAIAHVVRCFGDNSVVHVDGTVDPVRDMGTVETELLLADLETVSRKFATIEKTARSGNKEAAALFAVLSRIRTGLEAGKPVRSLGLSENELAQVRDYHFLTEKKVMYIANVDDSDVAEPEASAGYRKVLDYASRENAPVVPICGKIEAEMADMPEDERKEFLEQLGVRQSGLERVIKAGYELLGLRTFFTTAGVELRAWTIPGGWKAPKAAGVIHTDFEKGFIKAEVCRYEDLMKLKSEHAVREAGLMRLEGKEYVVENGDIILFKFSA